MTEDTSRDPLARIAEKAFREARASGLSIADAADIIAELLRNKIDQEYIDRAPGESVVHLQSVVSARTGDPSVQCMVGVEKWQWSPDVAREHARHLFEVAEAAVHDAAMVRWLTLGRMGLAIEEATVALGDLRRFRGDVDRKDWREGE